ncbi:probable G-protein coupled receptor 150 [Bombina bombina]|uniref:probable G-protein coupled receptor 150 n=1 Tax=Bombina bombina TaxID=8345 RepID=UPI00235A6FEC|nr:probable G-protein coupled receptor 150 [Bombina bombina]
MDDLFVYGSFSADNNYSVDSSYPPAQTSSISTLSSDEMQNAEPPSYNRQLRLVTMSIIFAVALVGNLVVLYKICAGKDKKRKINFLITHLALADLYVSIITLFSQIVWELLEDEWLVGDVACRIFKVLQVFGLIASSNIIAIVALERHHVIMNPLSTPLPTRCLAALGWLLSLLFSIPQALVFKVSYNGHGYRCHNIFGQLPKWHFQAYIIYSSVTVFFLPFCILVLAYSRILWVIWKKGKQAKPPTPQTGKHQVSQNTQMTKRPLRLVATNSCIPRAKVKTLKMTLVIIILFIVCGLPYFIVEMKVAFGTITGLDGEVMAVLGIFVVTNSAVNPYIYLFFRTNNVYLRRLEKKICFSCCLSENKEITFRRELLPSCAPTPRRERSSTTTSEVESSSSLNRLVSFLQPVGTQKDLGATCNSCI